MTRRPIGDFAADTDVSGGDGRYQATLSDSWELWGPAGGYVSTIALRAAGEHSRFDRPATYSATYLAVPEFGQIDIAVSTLRSAKRAEAIRVSVTQRGQAMIDATVWTIDSSMQGLEIDMAPMPDVSGPEGLKAWIDLAPDKEIAYAKFWSNIEERMIDQWFGPWRERPAGPPVRESWCRFRPRATFDDPYLDAGRSLMLIDTMGWPAAMMARKGPPPFVAPTIELAARFHRRAAHSGWLFCRADAPIAADGLMASTAMIWDSDGRLVASGGQQMLFRPVPA